MLWRAEVIESVFGSTPSAELLRANRSYYSHAIRSGTHIAVVAGECVTDMGCGALCLQQELPSPDNPSGRCAYLMNIYVRPEHRQKGIAHDVVRWLVQYAKDAGCGKIYLETTDAGRRIYEDLGFVDLKGYMKYEENDDRQI